MSKKSNFSDPRGHHIRIYSDLYDSLAFQALSPHDVLTYLALLRDLKGTNNGDLSLPLTKAKSRGIGHHVTLARSLRALVAVGLIALTRKGGCAKGGKKLVNLYRVTDREVFAMPLKFIEACPPTNDWKNIKSVADAKALIARAEAEIKRVPKKSIGAGHAMTVTGSSGVVVERKNTTLHDTSTSSACHTVTYRENGSRPVTMRISSKLSDVSAGTTDRTPRVSPLYIAIPGDQNEPYIDAGDGHE